MIDSGIKSESKIYADATTQYCQKEKKKLVELSKE